MAETGPISAFIDAHFRHFNAAALRDAAVGYADFLADGHRMLVSLAGAMSTAELGKSLAAMIRADKVHLISCTGANLEEDVYNLIAHDHYERVPHYRDLTPADEQALLDRHLNRVTDTCIPEEEAFRVLQGHLHAGWEAAAAAGERKFPHEFLYAMIRSGALEPHYQIDPADSWLVAAAEKNLPIVTPGWEDSTCGNIFAAWLMSGHAAKRDCVKLGIDAMMELAQWYKQTTADATRVGFFQIGGGIAGDFPICAVPMMNQDLEWPVPLWGYFCQISDSTTSYGSYSGAVPNEKITWGKLAEDTPKFIVESDATIVAPLIFAHILGW